MQPLEVTFLTLYSKPVASGFPVPLAALCAIIVTQCVGGSKPYIITLMSSSELLMYIIISAELFFHVYTFQTLRPAMTLDNNRYS